jgi:SAM-dependent methyltransferase
MTNDARRQAALIPAGSVAKEEEMARLESNRKMGYYPTPSQTLSHILDWIRPASGGRCHLLDPCCGTGKALQHFITDSATTYGVELDLERVAEAQKRLHHAVQGSIFTARINPLGSMGLLYLNPPYDWEEGERLEMKFLKHAIKWLCTDGVLVFIIPGPVLHYEKYRTWIGRRFDEVVVLRVAEADYPAFKQVVLFGKKRKEILETGSVAPPQYLSIEDVTPNPYTVPPTGAPAVFQGVDTVTDEEILAYRPRLLREIESICKSSPEATRLSPVLPLRKGHLVSLLTAGILDGRVETADGPLIVKGFSDRVQSTHYEEDKEITRDTFSVGIRVIEPAKGVWYDIT